MQTEWIILADYVEVVRGRLYLMGGAWEAVIINRADMTHAFGITAAWSGLPDADDQLHSVVLKIIDDVLDEELLQVKAEVDLLANGPSRLAQLAVNVSVTFKSFGGHSIVATVDGRESKRLPFHVERGQAFPG
ncbi:MAG: hypothetical protein IT335_13935 [Thermomicrobiales bacterium]|jgi:hypothetical protein|nr:hypothetical protein [Thermomicrobiales bacterium]